MRLALLLALAAATRCSASENSVGGSVRAAHEQYSLMAPSSPLTFHDSSGAPIQIRKGKWDQIVAQTKFEHFDMGPSEAMGRERQMNSKISSGKADPDSWHTHQYVMASTGNVDSARLLVEYGMAPSLQKQAKGGSEMQLAATYGDYEKAEKLAKDGQTGVVVHQVGQQPLVAAAMMGHADIVELLLREGESPDVVGNNGVSALHAAASLGHLEVIRVLVRYKASLNLKHKFAQSTPIHFAAEMGQAATVTLLCESGANVEAQKSHGGRPIHTAADTNQAEVTRALIECGADRNSLLLDDTTALYLAAQNGYAAVAEVLVGHACTSAKCGGGKDNPAQVPDVDYEMPTGPTEQRIQLHRDSLFGDIKSHFEAGNGATALHAACENDHLNVVKVLVAAGVNVDSTAMQGVTPLYSSITYNHPEITRYLATHGASLNVRMKRDGATALFVAASFPRAGAVHTKILLQAGADPNVANNDGATALIAAASLGRAEIVQLLLQSGRANIGTKAKSGQTALTSALHQNDGRITGLLIEAGAKVDASDIGADGQTPLHTAADQGARGIGTLRLLLQDPNVPVDARVTSTGATPLMMAAKAGAAQAVEALLLRGADANAVAGKALYGSSALYLACQGARPDIATVQALLKAGANPSARLAKPYLATPFFVAVERQHRALVAALLENPAVRSTMEMRGTGGMTPLMLLASMLPSKPKFIRLLLEHGAKGQAEDAKGRSPIIFAARKGDKARSAVKVLIKHSSREQTQLALDVAKHLREPKLIKLLDAALAA